MYTVLLWFCILLQASWTLPMNPRITHGLMSEQNMVERAVEPNNYIKKQRSESHSREKMERIIEMLRTDRWSKGQDILRYHRSQCNHMNQSWTHWQDSMNNQDLSSVYKFRVFTEPLKPTFPQQNLFRYMNRIYRCCKLGFSCRRIKGLQGTLDKGGKEINFYIDLDIFSLSIHRAELHLEVSADDQLTVIPALNINGITHSSFTQIRSGHIVDLALDVMFLLQALNEKEMEETVDKEVTELSLTLHCIQNKLHVPCDQHRVSLLHAPFIAFQY